ncbi:MAG: 2'-5' RNA ligase family protein [Gordonia sp. (in: high G+C Gram-positive bacteria)]|uniref:2'-5' RNA ligase family protein n=1 Tax=Gordonia sp. (in: high G+C Gram-positive bacteria) TaxID=84139 RepID=UPI0039E23F80
MVHSLELVFDDAAAAAVVAEVNRLSAAGLRAPHTDQRPHITLVAARAIGPSALTALAPVSQRLPATVRLGAPIVFSPGAAGSHGGFVLARAVVPSTELLGIHATVLRLAGEHIDGDVDHCRPGAWTPHVTLARRLTAEQVGAAVDVLADAGDFEAVAAGIRRWDGDTKAETVLPGRAC